MLAVEFVEFAVVGGMVLRAIPPVPVTAFGDQDFFEGQLPLRLAGRGSSLGIEIAGVVEIVPGAIVFRSADPDVEVGVNPGARNQRLSWRKFWCRCNGFGDRDGLDSGLALQRIIEAAQKFPAGLRIVFPRIFAIENDGNDRIMSRIQNRLRGLLNVVHEVIGGVLRGMPEYTNPIRSEMV